MAIGILVVPTDTAWLKASTAEGKKKPIPTPTAIARNIHSVRNLSKVESCFVVLLACAIFYLQLFVE
jgi:hypothetical protein